MAYIQLLLGQTPSPTVANCIIRQNTVADYGAGIHCCYSSPIVRKCTIIDNDATIRGRGAAFGGGIACYPYSNPTISNCTISGNRVYGGVYNDGGGGIYCSYESNATISNCTISNNSAYSHGGGIECDDSRPVITNCLIVNNTAGYRGGGVEAAWSSPLIRNCVLSGNSAYSYGGGIWIWGGCPTLINCTLTDNVATSKGGAFFCDYYGCSNVTNCVLWKNSAPQGHEVYLENDLRPTSISISYSVIQGGETEIFKDPGCTINWGDGNIDDDPCFVNADSNDFHLLPSSPCIDGGDNDSVPADTTDLDGDGNTTEPIPWDLDGNPRVVDGNNDGNAVVDMGAYEYYVPPIEVEMKFTPQALNPGSKGNWMKAHFVLPEEFAVEDVDADRPAVVEPGGIESDYVNVFVNEDDFVEIEAAFGRAEFCSIVTGGEPMEVRVVGWLTSGQQFYGTDTIKITTNTFEYLAVLASHWLEAECGKPDWCGGADLDHDSIVNFRDFVLFDGCCIEVIKQ